MSILGRLSSYLSSTAPLLGTALGGAFGGPIGAALGGAGGTALSQYLSGLSKDPFEEQAKQAQMELLQSLRQPGGVSFEPIEEQETRRFQQETIPGLAERFTGLGGQRSSAFGQLLGGAGADLSSRLAALRSQHELGQQRLDLGRLGQLGGLLSGQQQLASQANQSRLNQALQQIGLAESAGAFGQRQQAQQQSPLQALLQAAGLGTGKSQDVIYEPRQPGAIETAVPYAIRAGIKYGTGI